MTGAAGQAPRRRSRQAVPRPRLVKFFVTDQELADLDAAAERAGLARGAFATEAVLAAARGTRPGAGSELRERLVEFMSAAGLVRRVGTILNQAVRVTGPAARRAGRSRVCQAGVALCGAQPRRTGCCRIPNPLNRSLTHRQVRTGQPPLPPS